jgi:hypothetical protein
MQAHGVAHLRDALQPKIDGGRMRPLQAGKPTA